VEAGLFSAESLFVRFDFPRDAMLLAGDSYLEAIRSGKPVEMPPEIKTYVHELTHYLHYTTTPYGLFLQYCRVLQSRATIEIVCGLQEAGLSFQLPLLENVPIATGDIATRVQRGLALWLNVENLVTMLHADTERRFALLESFQADIDRVAAGQQPRLPPLLDLQEAFVRVQDTIADMLEQTNAAAQAAGNPVPMDPEGFDREAIRQEMAELPATRDRADLRFQDVSDILGNPWSAEAIIESAATAAEFWGSGIDYDRFSAWANTSVDPKLQVYRTCIAQGLSAIQTRRLPEFIPSYMALCELALYAPLLPQHAGLRRQYPSFRQILPTHRWMELIRAAAHVAPMRGIRDHGRYVTDICRKLGWVHPIQIIKVAVDGPDAVSNPLAMIYLWAQRWRAQSSGDFLGVNRFLFDPSPEATVWRDRFNFVILDYTDRTLYHHDKGFLQAMTTRHLNMLAMRCIMMGKTLTIAAPYRGDSAERRWMTEWLRDRFKKVFGRDFPMLQVV
jgi:hypothetical protein